MAGVGSAPARAMSSSTASALSRLPAYEATLIMVLYVNSLPCVCTVIFQSCTHQNGAAAATGTYSHAHGLMREDMQSSRHSGELLPVGSAGAAMS